MEDRFYQFLSNEKGLTEYAPSGRKSTVYNYCNRIRKVCEMERLTWNELAEHIAEILPKYDVGGIHEAYGQQSNRTVLNALRAFAEFCGRENLANPTK